MTLHVRARTPALLLEPARRELLTLDPALAVFDVQTMEQHLADSLVAVRMGAVLLGLFGALALGLAALGLYGVIAFTVSQRQRELAVRLALGARPRDVRRLVIRRGMVLALAGAAIGALLGAAASAVIAAKMYGVTPPDLVTLAVVMAMQISVALLACWLPARRATRLDPMVALRSE